MMTRFISEQVRAKKVNDINLELRKAEALN